MKLKDNKNLMIGLMVIVTVAILYFGINYLKGINMMRPSNYYYAKFDDIKGLLESSKITSRGYGVGNVHQIDYNYEDPTDGVVVVLQLDDQLRIPKGSKVLLSVGLMGGASLSLDLKSNGSGAYYDKGDTISTLLVPGMLDAVSDQVMPKVAEIIPQLDSLLLSLHAITDNQKIQSIITNVDGLTYNLKSASIKLNNVMTNDVEPFMQDAKVIAHDFSKVSTNLSQIDFQLTITKVNSTLDSVNGLSNEIQNGNGTISLLLKDPSLYNTLNSTMGSANSLLQDLEKNPKRYVQFSLIQRKEKHTEE